MRLLQVMAGAAQGGAEGFYERLCLGLEEKIEQQLVFKPYPNRLQKLRDLSYTPAPFKKRFNFETSGTLKKLSKSFAPTHSLYWMNRAASFAKYTRNGINIGRLGGYYNLKYYKHCQYLICNTPDLVEYCKKEGWSENRVQYMPNFASPPTGNTTLPKKLAKTGPTLFAMGRLHENKAFDVLITAMQQLPEVTLWLAGEGPLKAKLQQQAANNIIFLPWQTDISPLMHHADAFVCPSRHEPLGNVMLEGFAHKKLVIATKNQGAQHLIEHEKTGLLSDIDDADALAKNINQGLNNLSQKQELVANAHEFFQKNYSKEAVIQQYLDYFSCLSQ